MFANFRPFAVCGMTATSFLAACVAQDTTPVAPVYRDVSAQIASQTNLTEQDLLGTWYIRHGYAFDPAQVSGFNFSLRGPQRRDFMIGQFVGVCDHATCRGVGDRVSLRNAGPGRWTPQQGDGAFLQDDLWVLWIDGDRRTAAIGTPSGRFGYIIDKSSEGGEDRIAAAREIMDWFGYDMTGLRGPHRAR